MAVVVEDGAPLADILELSVGGVRFATTRGTLRRIPGTFFDAMFSGRFGAAVDARGAHFIDRDGTHFRHILNFLRCPAPFDADGLGDRALMELRRECAYYGLEDLVFPRAPRPVAYRFTLFAFASGAGDTFVARAPKRRECVELVIELRFWDRRWYLGDAGGDAATRAPALFCHRCNYWFDADLAVGFSPRTQRLFNARFPASKERVRRAKRFGRIPLPTPLGLARSGPAFRGFSEGPAR